ncbi:MAG: carbohydrate-binding domain-containing protein [bacterium]
MKYPYSKQQAYYFLKRLVTTIIFIFFFLNGTTFYILGQDVNNSAFASVTLFINEFMAGNNSTIEDPQETGSFEDWIEIYNPGSTNVNMGGMYLTDDPNKPDQWQIPAGVSIPAKGYLFFWADNDEDQGITHTNFKLSLDGEMIILLGADGTTIIDSIEFGAQITDISYGRYPDGAAEWGFMTATPGAANNNHNKPPQITGIDRTPIIPNEGESVFVTCSVTDEENVAYVNLTYNSGTGEITTSMYDDGAHNDGGVKDNLYSAVIPAFTKNTVVKYYVTATDNNGVSSHDPVNVSKELYVYVVGYIPPMLFINEFMAENTSAVENPDQTGSFEDWIEIYNAGDLAVNMSGMYLTDDLSNPTLWKIPGGVNIPSKGCLVFWADNNKDQGIMHANFKLNKDGEEIGLFATTANGNMTIDKVSFGEQISDISYSRIYDYGAPWVFTKNPSPGESGSFPDGTYTCNFSYVIDSYKVVQKSVAEINSVNGYNASLGKYESSYVFWDKPGGNNFSISPGIDYIISISGSSSTGSDSFDMSFISEIKTLMLAMPVAVPGSEITNITLQGDSTILNGSGATFNGQNIIITSAGIYNISGTLNDGQIIVDTQDEETVELVLNGADISCSSSAPVYIISAKDTIITLADGTENYITDEDTYILEDTNSDEPNAAVFSRDDLTIGGNGSLTVHANYNDGITSKDDLEITGGSITVNAVNDGIRGRDSFTVRGGTVTVIAGGDGMQSNNDGDGDVEVGNIYIEGGTFYIAAGADGIQANTRVLISGGDISISSGGGSNYTTGSSDSAKGIKAGVNVTIEGGDIDIDSSDDAIHSNETLTINGGYITLASGDDGIYSGSTLEISGGDISITKCYDGLSAGEADISYDGILTISGGSIQITVTENKSKGIKSAKNMILSGGDININTSGGVVLEQSGSGYNPVYCSGIKCDSNVTISGANISITSTGIAGKGISSDQDIYITEGNINLNTSGAGSTYRNSSGATDSYNATCITADGDITILDGSVTTLSSGSAGKGISAGGELTVGDITHSPTLNITTTGAKFLISGSWMNAEYATAKAVKSDGAITINNGMITMSSSDDSLKSDTSITINNGDISIVESLEGIESPYITVNNGNVGIVASDDGFNSTKGIDMEGNDGSCLYLNGGNIYVNVSKGDGIDGNGNIVITGGTIIVHGPKSQPEVGMDYNGTCNISGGLLVISGTNSNMTQATSSSSQQYCIKATTTSGVAANTLFHIQDANGNDIVTFKPVRNYYSIIFSSPGLKSGSTYYIYTGGSSTGTETNGLYSGGTYSGGTQRKSFIVYNKVTSVSF